ncbi:type A chloramphenicol O-acetyltransferase [Alkalicoccobacillus murimartini]|uniref:Chloramphenicol O-acetyltransferase type A n=1 Tax=Alkalicoccobacillus murimartini TaxID=171685 RepID=A0ABT9YF37_9BACI|nr:type A chloramphenicol O-acetyltransferase [Alkalicoccobacillus murimartini]MDQ0205679.1 chloramphenicol O-acetyltransferase type A [Alkalicoccobacillus murimartini]
MKFIKIDRSAWNREQYFTHYLKQQTSFSLTCDIDVQKILQILKKKRMRFYPAFIYMVTQIVNGDEVFRTCFNENKELGYWEQMIPSYTIFDNESKMFSSIWTETTSDFATFHKQYELDVQKWNGTEELFPKMPVPPNTFPISMLPWSHFTAFNLNINQMDDFLLPIITAGKYIEKYGVLTLPVTIQAHHAVCDGYHATTFMNKLQFLADQCENWV